MNDRADYMEDEQIQVVLKYQPEWITQLKQWNEQVQHTKTNLMSIILTVV